MFIKLGALQTIVVKAYSFW